MDDAVTAWGRLEESWRICLSLAWEAFVSGTIPVGAVVVDGRGTIVARGRNRVYDDHGPEGQLAHSFLAHAEVNALVGLDPERRYRDHVLYSSLEPCLLCVGAAHRATVRAIRYAGAEPFRGVAPGRGRIAGDVLSDATFDGPLDGPFGLLASALPFAFYVQTRGLSDPLIAAYEQELPHVVAAGHRLAQINPSSSATWQPSLADALRRLWPLVTQQ